MKQVKLSPAQMLEKIKAQEKIVWTKELWHKAMDDNSLLLFPTTPEQVEWFEDLLVINPKEQQKFDNLYNDHNQEKANEYFCLKMFLKMFLREHRQAQVSVFVLNFNEKSNICKVIDPTTAEHYEFKI